MIYYHVDVFSNKGLSGNGLTVVFHEEELSAEYMQKIAREFKQFETIFLKEIGNRCFRARIFTVEEELDFAGHPILGAVSAIHEERYPEEKSMTITFELNAKKVQTKSIKIKNYFHATMNQGVVEFLGIVKDESIYNFLHNLNLKAANLHHTLPMEVISAGLPYLIIPLSSGLSEAKITTDSFEMQLSKINAKFVYLLDVEKMEGRTWDNLGVVEDVATASAAGPVGAYLYKWNILKNGESIILNQGRFVGRPSKMRVYVDQYNGEIEVAGDIKLIVRGDILL